MIEIKQASTEKEFDLVRSLYLSYLEWVRQSFPEVQDKIDKYFKSVLDVEMAALPGAYGPPTGILLLAYYQGEVAGTVAVRKVSDQMCEMKRMFALSKFHGSGIGRALATELIHQSRQLGYERMRLDTTIAQVAAQGLYRSLGFRETQPFYAVPEDIQSSMLFFELKL